MPQDWSALGQAITDRLDEQGMTMTDLANRSGVSLTTVRELVQVLNIRKRNSRTLVALSEALDWPSDHLAQVLRGQPATRQDAPDGELAELRRELSEMQGELAQLRTRVAKLEGVRAVDA